MRENTRILSLPVGDQSMNFRITRLDAFSGASLLRMLALAEGNIPPAPQAPPAYPAYPAHPVYPAPKAPPARPEATSAHSAEDSTPLAETTISAPSPASAASSPVSAAASSPASFASVASPAPVSADRGADQTADQVAAPVAVHAASQPPASPSASRGTTMADLLFALPEPQFEKVMRTCLSRAEVSLPAGYIRVYSEGCWGIPDLEFETLTCLRLTLAEMAFTLEGFFPVGGKPSRTEGSVSFR